MLPLEDTPNLGYQMEEVPWESQTKKHGVIQCFSKVLADDRLSSYCWAGTGVSQPGGDLHERHHGSMDGWMNGCVTRLTALGEDGWCVLMWLSSMCIVCMYRYILSLRVFEFQKIMFVILCVVPQQAVLFWRRSCIKNVWPNHTRHHCSLHEGRYFQTSDFKCQNVILQAPLIQPNQSPKLLHLCNRSCLRRYFPGIKSQPKHRPSIRRNLRLSGFRGCEAVLLSLLEEISCQCQWWIWASWVSFFHDGFAHWQSISLTVHPRGL